MKRGRAIFLSFAVIIIACQGASAQTESGRTFSGVTEYLESIAYNPTDTIISKICSFIESIDDEETQSVVAGIMFDWYSNAPFMGQEAVAVYIADNYFLNKRLKWSDENTYPLLYTFAEFNRQSLVGMSAPELILKDAENDYIDIRQVYGEIKILYFYDIHCASCAKQTPELIDILKAYDGIPITLFAIYTQDNFEEWQLYVKENFDTVNNDKVLVLNLWDPDFDSDFQRKYSVLSTPSMTLLDCNNFITGRRLDAEALGQLLGVQNNGASQYRNLFETLFSQLSPIDSSIAISIGNAFCNRIGEDKALYRETFSEMFRYLKNSAPDAAVAIAQKFIISEPDIWAEEYLNEISTAIKLFNLNKVGEKANDLTLTDKNGKTKSIYKVKSKYTLLFFHLVTCDECKKMQGELLFNNKFLKKYKIKVLDIYVGKNFEIWKNSICKKNQNWLYLYDCRDNSEIHSKYDISIVPKLYLLDIDKRVIAKNLSVNELLNFLSVIED